VAVLVKDKDTRPIDLLASVFRSAVTRRSPDALLMIASVAGPSVEIDPRELTTIARFGDGGRRPNPLWSHWVTHGRTLRLVESAPIKKPPQRKH
jgi:hypothetical protein